MRRPTALRHAPLKEHRNLHDIREARARVRPSTPLNQLSASIILRSPLSQFQAAYGTPSAALIAEGGKHDFEDPCGQVMM